MYRNTSIYTFDPTLDTILGGGLSVQKRWSSAGLTLSVGRNLELIRDQSVRPATNLTDVRRTRERSGGATVPQLVALEAKLKAALRRMDGV